MRCCVLYNHMVFSRLLSGLLVAFVRKGQVQNYKSKHCSLVGIQYINIKTRRGHLRALAGT